jgi:septum formation protein
MQDIILASQSPRRKMLLEWAEVPFQVIVQSTDEKFPRHLSMPEIAIHIARNKALAVRPMYKPLIMGNWQKKRYWLQIRSLYWATR